MSQTDERAYASARKGRGGPGEERESKSVFFFSPFLSKMFSSVDPTHPPLTYDIGRASLASTDLVGCLPKSLMPKRETWTINPYGKSTEEVREVNH